MKIAIVGAGAVGAFFGALLVRAGQDVRFLARGSQLDALRSSGITIRSTLLGEVTSGPVVVSSRASELGAADLVLVCVKTHQTAAAVDDVRALMHDDTDVVTLQNGVDSDELLAAHFGRERVFPGVVYVGATIDGPGIVTHVAAGTIALGARAGSDPSRLLRIRDALAASGQPIRIADDIQHDRWRKLIWNAGFNTVSAVSGLTPPELLARPDTRALLANVMREVVLVAQAQGIGLELDDVEGQITWTEKAGAIRTSMMVDRQRGRGMEVDALIGVVVRKGKEHGVPTPYSETMFALLSAIDSKSATGHVAQ
jgi:2-dehydropantoate 2-reductase